jgi:hypothetical protein
MPHNRKFRPISTKSTKEAPHDPFFWELVQASNGPQGNNVTYGAEILFIEGRVFRGDYFCSIEGKKFGIIIEVNGINQARGGHRTREGVMRDYEKSALGLVNGWVTVTIPAHFYSKARQTEAGRATTAAAREYSIQQLQRAWQVLASLP